MSTEEIDRIIAQGEGVSIEFKKAKEKVPQSLYETVVSFANTRGGYILLGVDDDGTVSGIQPENRATFLKNIATALNSKDNINPEMQLDTYSVEYEGKTVIAVKVPASSQVHDHAGRIYVREYETDIDVTGNQHTMRRLFLKKGTFYTETHIYPGLKMSDMDESLFVRARNLIRSNRFDHPWLDVDNMQMLREAMLYWNDYENNHEGFSLAAALFFGKDLTIQSLLPAYKVEAMVRINNKDRYDDRLTLRTNLIDTYLQLRIFINRYLPDKFYMEGDQRIDLRDRIFREVIGNIIIHREYTDATATELIIEEDAVRTSNPNIPYFHDIMDLKNFCPHPKNPNIRKFFMALGWADEIGSGIRNTLKYLPRYVEKATPVFIDRNIFRTVIPLVRYTMANFADHWLNWLEIDQKWRLNLKESLENIEVDGNLQKMSWEEQIYCLSINWIQKATSIKEFNISIKNENRPSHDKKPAKLENSQADVYKSVRNGDIASNEKNRPGQSEKPTKLPNKKLTYIVAILLMLGVPLSIDELMEIFEYRHKDTFRQNYIKPLESLGFIKKTNPEKPTAPNQKYLITEQGKRFLTAKND